MAKPSLSRSSDVTDSFGQSMPVTDVQMSAVFGDTTGNGIVNSSDVGR